MQIEKPGSTPQRNLETFETSPHVARQLLTSKEVSALCPWSGQPDLYTIEINVDCQNKAIESKSLKTFLWSFRDERLTAEGLASEIAKHLKALEFRGQVRVTQAIRGGIELEVVAETHP